MICSFLVFPLVAVCVISYHLFSTPAKKMVLFNTVRIHVSQTEFSFTLSPTFYILMGIVFVGTFLITYAIKSFER